MRELNRFHRTESRIVTGKRLLMRIAIVGAGNVGKALGEGFARSGHQVTYIGRETSAAERAKRAEEAEAVVLSVPADQAKAAVAGLELAGKIVVDCTNPLKADLSGLTTGPDSSACEQLAAALPGAHVVKAFNTVGFDIMRNPVFGDRHVVMLVAGDDAAAKERVMALARDLGFDPLDAGPLAAARLLEPFAMLWISLAYQRGLGRNFAFALLRR